MGKYSAYSKAIITALVAGVGAIVSTLGNGELSDLDTKYWLLGILAVLGSGGWVWLTENVHGVFGGAIKTIGSFLTAGLGSLVLALDDHVISQGEWLTAFSIAVGASGLVYQVKGKAVTPAPSSL